MSLFFYKSKWDVLWTCRPAGTLIMKTCVRTSVLQSMSTVQLCTDMCQILMPNMRTDLSVSSSVHVSSLVFMQTTHFSVYWILILNNINLYIFNVIAIVCSGALCTVFTHTMKYLVITGRICHRQLCRYFVYSRADFGVIRPAGATRCTDQGQIWQGGGDRRSAPPCQIWPWSVQGWGFTAPKTEKNSNFTNISAPKGRVPCTIFIKFT